MQPTEIQEPIIGVILAGGESRRMQHDKGMLSMGSGRLIDLVFDRLSKQCTQIVISGPNAYDLSCPAISDLSTAPNGPVGALYSIWENFRTGPAKGFITVPVDGPNLPLDFTVHMRGDQSAVARTKDGVHPTFAYWVMTDLAQAFAQIDLSGSPSLRAIAKLCKAQEVLFEDPRAFYNINTPQDYEVWTAEQNHMDRKA